MKTLFYIKSLLIIGIIIFLYSCTSGNKKNSETEEVEVLPEDIMEMRDDQIKMAGIQTGLIEKRSLGEQMEVNGQITVAPNNSATVCMPMGGFIKSTNLIPGNFVSKDQTLAVIENQDYVDIQLSYLEAVNKLTYAKAEYDRHSELYKDEVYSEKNVQQITVDYKNLTAVVKSLSQKLKLIGIDPDQLSENNISSTVNLVSPISGYLKSVNISIGKYVSPSDVLFEIVNNDKLFMELTVFEKDAGRVREGQKIKFFVNNGNGEHEAVITQTGKSVSNDKTLKVYSAVKCNCKSVLPGMYVSAFIEENYNMVTVLPSEAIVNFNDKDYIFAYEKEKEEEGKPFTEYRMIEVKKGVALNGFTEIKLPEGFDINVIKVVIKGAYNLLSAKKNAGEMAC